MGRDIRPTGISMDAKDALGEPTALISRSALIHNAAVVRRAVGRGVKICAVVKANAYGHDAAIVTDALANFTTNDFGVPSVDAFAVADLDEAIALPVVPQPVLIFRPVENAFLGRQRSRIETAIRSGWWLTVASPTAADDIARIAVSIGRRAHLHLMVDTGMNRAGLSPDELDGMLAKIRSRDGLRLGGLYTHFANSEDAEHPFNIVQLAGFLDKTDAIAEEGHGRVLRHAANSGALFLNPPSRLDMVRPGLSLYGIEPTGKPSMDRALKPVLRWTAPLVGMRQVQRGQTIGYGQTWIAERDTRVGLVPIGYADGYPRELSNRGLMLIHDCPAPVLGRVSMDLTTIDLSQVPMARIGDTVVVLDDDPLSVASVYRLAAWAGTIPYEILSRIGARVRRIAAEPADGQELSAIADGDAEEP
jgi:alanine racemase